MARFKPEGEQPRVRAIRLVGEWAGGLLGGVLGGLLGVIVGALIVGNLAPGFVFHGRQQGAEAGGQLGILVGMIVGGSMGVWMVGERRNIAGSVLATLGGGGLLGGLLAVGGFSAISDADVATNLTLPIILLVVTPLGAMLGFELTRHYTTPVRRQ